MNVVYACDDKYAMLAGVSIESLLRTNHDVDEIRVFVLTNGVSEENAQKLISIAEQNHRKINLVTVSAETFKSKKLCIDAQRWSLAAFARLFTPQLLPDLDRILYLDCDTIVLGSLMDVWNVDLGSCTCAAVAEPFSAYHKKNVGMDKGEVYYNSGVMLIDLDKWRNQDAISLFVASIDRHRGRVPYVDQGVLNEVFRSKFYCLPAKYNVFTEYYDFSYGEVERYRADKVVYSEIEIEEAAKFPVIMHYVSSFMTPRPWVQGSTHPYAQQWDEYCAYTPWKRAKKWSDTPGKSKLMLRWMFRCTPRRFAIWVAMIMNSYVRPMLDSAYCKKSAHAKASEKRQSIQK